MRALCLLALFAAGAEAREKALAGKSTTASGQFVIYSNDATRRTNLARRADEARSQWLQKVGDDETSSHPIIIQDLIGAAKPHGSANITLRVT